MTTFKNLCLLFFQVCCYLTACAQYGQSTIALQLIFEQTAPDKAKLVIQQNEKILQTLYLDTHDKQRSNMTIDKQFIGDCQISQIHTDTMGLTINFLMESRVYADLVLKKLPYSHILFSNQRDNVTIQPPRPIDKTDDSNSFNIKTDRSKEGMKVKRINSISTEFSNGVAAYQDDITQQYGLIDTKGNIIQPPNYSSIQALPKNWLLRSNEQSIVTDVNGQNQFTSKSIEVLGKETLVLVLPNDSIAVYSLKNKTLHNYPPNIVIHAENGNRFIIIHEEKHGLINTEGELVVPFMYTYIYWHNDRWLKVQKDGGLYGLIDIDGKEILPIMYEDIGVDYGKLSFDDDKIMVKNQGLWGVVRLDNTVLVPIRYPNTFVTKAGYWCCYAENDHTFVIDSLGHEILSLPYYLSDGIISSRMQVQRKGRFGLIDANGKEIFPCVADQPIAFYYANKEGGSLPSPVACIRQDLKYGIIDTDGHYVLPAIYDQILPQSFTPNYYPYNYKANYYAVVKDGKAGVVNAKGEITIPIEYDAVSFACNDIVRLYKDRDSKCGWATAAGKIYIQPSLPTKTCQYLEYKALTYPTTTCDRPHDRHPCDPIRLPCYQCERECPEEALLEYWARKK